MGRHVDHQVCFTLGFGLVWVFFSIYKVKIPILVSKPFQIPVKSIFLDSEGGLRKYLALPAEAVSSWVMVQPAQGMFSFSSSTPLADFHNLSVKPHKSIFMVNLFTFMESFQMCEVL